MVDLGAPNGFLYPQNKLKVREIVVDGGDEAADDTSFSEKEPRGEIRPLMRLAADEERRFFSGAGGGAGAGAGGGAGGFAAS